MKKKLVIVVLASVFALSAIAGCGSTSDSGNTSETAQEDVAEEKEYLTANQISSMYTSPDDYKGKYVVLTGQLYSSPEIDGEDMAIQLYEINGDNTCIVYAAADSSLQSEDYVIIDGRIDGSLTGENYFGAELTLPLIVDATVTKTTYMDAVVPTISEVTPEGAVASQHDISIQVDKVEYAETETRVYVTETNNSSDNCSIYANSALLVQNGTQYEVNYDSSTTYYTDLQEPTSDLLPSATTSGVIIFPALDASAGFQLHLEAYSDNYELDFEDFVIDIPAA